jgi:hypothetical protein
VAYDVLKEARRPRGGGGLAARFSKRLKSAHSRIPIAAFSRSPATCSQTVEVVLTVCDLERKQEKAVDVEEEADHVADSMLHPGERLCVPDSACSSATGKRTAE